MLVSRLREHHRRAAPKRLQPRAKGLLGEIIEAPTPKDASRALEVFREGYGAKYPKTLAKLDRDWKPLTAFYDYPAEHWRHLWTTNPIESSFATVRLRTRVTKGAGSKTAALDGLQAPQVSPRSLAQVSTATSSSLRCSTARSSRDGIKVIDDETTTDERVAGEFEFDLLQIAANASKTGDEARRFSRSAPRDSQAPSPH